MAYQYGIDILNMKIVNITEDQKKEKSIFLMFTWREIRRGENISDFYLKNVINFLKNERLKNILEEKNISFYYAFHHRINRTKLLELSKISNNLYKYKNHNQISDALKQSSLIISDFSSVIFELMYRKKPIVLYIPDIEDPNIKKKYDQGYYDIINAFKNGTSYFENMFFDLEEAVDKVIYYIQRDFKLDEKLIKFYEKFGLNTTNNTKTFIEYLKNLK